MIINRVLTGSANKEKSFEDILAVPIHKYLILINKHVLLFLVSVFVYPRLALFPFSLQPIHTNLRHRLVCNLLLIPFSLSDCFAFSSSTLIILIHLVFCTWLVQSHFYLLFRYFVPFYASFLQFFLSWFFFALFCSPSDLFLFYFSFFPSIYLSLSLSPILATYVSLSISLIYHYLLFTPSEAESNTGGVIVCFLFPSSPSPCALFSGVNTSVRWSLTRAIKNCLSKFFRKRVF